MLLSGHQRPSPSDPSSQLVLGRRARAAFLGRRGASNRYATQPADGQTLRGLASAHFLLHFAAAYASFICYSRGGEARIVPADIIGQRSVLTYMILTKAHRTSRRISDGFTKYNDIEGDYLECRWPTATIKLEYTI